MRGKRVRPLIVVLALLAAGCLGGGPTEPPPTTRDSCSSYSRPEVSTSPGFEGDNAMAHVLRLVCDFTQTPPREQPRIPGTRGQALASKYLYSALEGAGWTAWFQNFTGHEYDGIPKGSVASWAQGCSTENRQRMLGLPFANVGADLGSSGPVTVLMAHYDSKRFASQERDPANQTRPVLGANDGASGVGVLVEAARVLVGTPRSSTLRILLVDGEDGFEDCHPLAGSIYYARTLSEAERSRIEAVYLLDMVGDPDPHYCLAGDDGLRERMREAAREAAAARIEDAPPCAIYDDHTAFADAGFAALDLIDYDTDRPGGFPAYWHTTRDTPDRLSPQSLAEAGRVVVELVG